MTTAQATLAPRTWGAGEPWVEIDVPIRFTKRENQLGWYVSRADNGHKLGMISKKRSSGEWIGYVLNEAYFPVDTDLLGRLNSHPLHRASSFEGETVSITDTRSEAANAILWTLVDRHADSVEDLVQEARAPFLATRKDLA